MYMGNNRRIMSEIIGDAVDIARGFVDELYKGGLASDVQIIGGVGSAALGNSGVELYPEDKLIVVPQGLKLPRYREDGTLRDLDVLVTNVDDEVLAAVDLAAKASVPKGALDRSIFGYQPLSRLEDQIRNPVLAAALVHVSDRYVEQEGTEVITAQKSVFPFAVDVPPEALET